MSRHHRPLHWSGDLYLVNVSSISEAGDLNCVRRHCTVEYVKAHSGVEFDCVQQVDEIAEEALEDGYVAPPVTYVVPCPERHGPGLMDKVIHDIAHGDNATKRSHDTIVHTGHKVHPSKSQRTTTTVEPPPSNISALPIAD